MSTHDDKTIALLHLLDEYEQLSNRYRANFIQGHQNLSRASFQNISVSKSRFGLDMFDLRPYPACKTIESGDEASSCFVVVDRLKTQKEREEQEELEEETSSEKAEQATPMEISNRKTKSSKAKLEKDTSVVTIDENDEKEPQFKDPIVQFGAFAPKELKTSQANFSAALLDSISLINLRHKISNLVTELETNQ
ncbi:uncharacterized protein LODBEIA_P19190 [Lodderomyces beijingensis]|uniref:Vacuolar ATPase assembly protein VMA22 n=1 Tax=Lodderomyces beijingensis TaxID=1775926 RepID=A0ABP0ZN40_9ASCO